MDFFDEEFNGKVNVPPNIQENKQTIIGKFDITEIIYILIAGILFAVVTYSLVKINIDITIALLFGLILCSPIVLMGFKTFNGLKFEDYLYVLKSNKINSSTVRVNNSDNLYELLEKNKNIQNNISNTEQVKLDPISRIVFNIITKNQYNNTNTKKNNNKVKEKDNKNKQIKTEQQYIYNSIRQTLINTQIKNINELINFISDKYNIKTEIFNTKKEDNNELIRISFKTNKIKHFVSGEHINKNLKLEKLNYIIDYIYKNKISKKQIRQLLIDNVSNKNKRINKGIVVYK